MTRALIQIAAAALGGVLAFVIDLPDWLRLVVVAVAAASIAFALLGLFVRSPARTLPEGACTVRLEAAGEQPVAVVRELRRQLGLDLVGAKQTVDAVPVDLATAVARPDAERVAGALRAAGATVTVTQGALSEGTDR